MACARSGFSAVRLYMYTRVHVLCLQTRDSFLYLDPPHKEVCGPNVSMLWDEALTVMYARA